MSISIKHAHVGLFFVMLLVGVASSALGQATVTTDKANYSPSETVVIAGTGWMPGETVSLTILADIPPVPLVVLYTTADEAGSIHNEEFVVGEEGIDTQFLLEAQGQTSGLSGETWFSAIGANGNDQVTVTTDKGNYSPGETVVIIGTGWMPGESVSLSIYADSSGVARAILNATADESGGIRNEEFVVGQQDINVYFLLRAQGQISGMSAETQFADARIEFAPAVNFAVGASPWSVAASDLDGDGDNDLATANLYGSNVSVLRNNGNGTFAPAVSYAAGSCPRSVAARDLDGDGDNDLAVANYCTSNVSVLMNNGNGTFAPAVSYAAGIYPASVAASDLDGDGYNDLAVANQGSNTVSVLRNNRNGTFAPPVNFAVGGHPWSVAASDLDGDVDNDLVVAVNEHSNNVSVLINITPANRPPVANNDTYKTNEDRSLNIARPGVLSNDSDPDKDPITAVLDQGAGNGKLTLKPDGSFQYLANHNWYGTDNFSYKAFDGVAYSNVATVTIEVTSANDPPKPAVERLPLVSGECPGPVIVPVPIANDVEDGVITGTTSDPVTYTAAGTYTVHWIYTDTGGLTATQDQTVEVADNTAPQLTCPSNRSSCAARRSILARRWEWMPAM